MRYLFENKTQNHRAVFHSGGKTTLVRVGEAVEMDLDPAAADNAAVDGLLITEIGEAERDPLDHDGDGKKGGDASHEDAPAPEAFDPELADAYTDDELRAHIEARDGKAPHPNMGHAKLVKLARGEA